MAGSTPLGKLCTRIEKLEDKLNRTNTIANELAANMGSHLLSALPYDAPLNRGGANDMGQVSSKVKAQKITLKWYGPNVYYLEFGAGLHGADKYSDPERMAEANYEPQITGHRFGTRWILPTSISGAGNKIFTKGWEPYAPFYKTILYWKEGGFNKALEPTVRDLTEKYLK